MQEIKCKDCGKTLLEKENNELIVQCRRCSQNKGIAIFKKINLKHLIENIKDIIKI